MPISPFLRAARAALPLHGSRIAVRAYGSGRNVVEELKKRGFVAALTSPKLRELVTSPTAIYSGVDPSADSLHVGNLLPLLGLLHFHASGHQAIALIGGATGSIGDPSGKSTERPLLSSEALQHNVEGITSQVHRFFERGMEYIDRKGGIASSGNGGTQVKVLNNLEWFKDVSFLDFLRTTGKLAKVNVMLARDSVKNRLESGISFTEFSYQLLQAHDFAHLHKYHDCRIQLGGSDQWGNIVAGIDLIKRQLQRSEFPDDTTEDPAFGLTIPLLTTSTGAKFGKSAGNAIWLDPKRTSVSDFYQFFVRSTDEDVERYLRIFTFLPLPQIDEVMREHDRSRKDREAQKVLAREVTELVHGRSAVDRAERTTEILYNTPARDLRGAEVVKAFEDDGRMRKVRWEEVKDVPISKLLVTFGMVKARADANRAISAQSLHLNDNVVSDPRMTLHRQQLVDGKLVVLRMGSRNHLILYIED